MIGRLLTILTLATLTLVGLGRADGGGGVEEGIECGQWTSPESLGGLTFVLGPFPDKPSALAASQNPGLIVPAIGDLLWPGFMCPGCANGAPGCNRGIAFIEAPVGVGAVREGVGGWYADFEAASGSASATCSGCP